MEKHSGGQPPSQPTLQPASRRARWFALFALTGINYLNYIDRNIFSALLPAIKDELHFTDTELGVLGSAFLYAYIFSAPFFGRLGDKGSRSKIMSVGVGIWSVATAFSGTFSSFVGQFLTRATVGFGESAYTVIAPSAIADHFPKNARGKVFAIYSGAITIGSALGYVLGGWLNARYGWRQAFFVVGVPGLALAVLLFFIPDPLRGGQDEPAAEIDSGRSVVGVYKALFKNGGFLFTVLGYAAYTFVVGGLAFWMPSYLVRYFNVTLLDADVQFGAMTVAGGFCGTVIGGFWADSIERKTGNGYLKVSIYSMVFAIPLFFLALSIKTYMPFMASLFLLETALFLCLSPLDAAVISYVRPAWRATAMALDVFLIHVLGDGISRPFMGALSDHSDLHTAMSYLPFALMVAGVLWLIGLLWFWQPAPWPAGALTIPQYQAHRGSRPKGSGIVENTMAAFRQASTAGALMVECDVHITKDGQAVVFHDSDLKRLGGRDDLVKDMTVAEMARYTGAPLLSELLSDPAAPRFVNIEVKSSEALFSDGALEAATVRAVHECSAEARVMFSSFNPFALRRLAKLAPKVPRALLATEEKDPTNKAYLSQMLLGFWSRAQLIHLDNEMITPGRMEQWHERGLKVAVWTVNDPVRAKELLSLGAVSVISDSVYGM
jgi:glycerophosphoryl diester phosphodiesterase/predicted MFS family arabinose efflux permease